MPKLNTTVKSVRIDNDKLAELEGRLGGKTINAWLNEQIECYLSGGKGDKGVNPQKNSEKTGLTPNKDLEEIDSMAKFFGMEGGDLLKGVCAGLMDGNLTVENGKVVGVPEIDLENLKEACHERGIGMQEAIDKTVKNLRSGK